MRISKQLYEVNMYTNLLKFSYRKKMIAPLEMAISKNRYTHPIRYQLRTDNSPKGTYMKR